MKVVLDTNVFVSGVFFSGPPFEILSAWRHGRLRLVVSAEILDEYRRVGERLESGYAGTSFSPVLVLVALHSEVVVAPSLAEPVCDDPTDDKFFACAIAAGCSAIVSGDKHLLRVGDYRGVKVYRPRAFLERYLAS
ncbi:MAG: putative toxin-antitoxin system toxin component, PIN family [Actinomycetes bacterium]